MKKILIPILIIISSFASTSKRYIRKMLNRNELLVKEGSIFVFQDIRGRFMSEGEFKVLRYLSRSSLKKQCFDDQKNGIPDVSNYSSSNNQGISRI